MDEKQAKRLLAFALGSVLLVMLAWVGYSLRWIRDRNASARIGVETGRFVILTYDSSNGRPPPAAPRGLWLFGDEGMAEVWHHPNEPLLDELWQLFPEAEFKEKQWWCIR